jgi:hypothetical protein
MQCLLFLWSFTLVLVELGVFDTWKIPPAAVGAFVVSVSIGVFGHTFHAAYVEIDWEAVSEIGRGTSVGTSEAPGDDLPSDEIAVHHPEEVQDDQQVDVEVP